MRAVSTLHSGRRPGDVTRRPRRASPPSVFGRGAMPQRPWGSPRCEAAVRRPTFGRTPTTEGAPMTSPLVPVFDLSTAYVLLAVAVSVFAGMLAVIGVVRLAHDQTERVLGGPRARSTR